ncbi:MAG TPA: peptidase C45, partial [bacterium]
MKSKRFAFFILAVVILLAAVCCAGTAFAQMDPRLNRAARTEQDGWILVHLEGPPADIGYQHGSLLAPEIDDALKTLAGFLKGSTGKDWDFLRDVAQHVFLPKLG